MILEEFDQNPKAIINPEDLIEPISDFPSVAVSCFARETFKRLLENFNHELITTTSMANIEIPIYRVFVADQELAFFNAPVGASDVYKRQSQKRKFTFENVPDGHYYLLACELLEDLRLTKNYVLKHNFRWGSDEPLTFSGDSIYQEEISMRRPLPSDPPITVNLPVLIMRSLAKQAQLRIRKFLS